MSDYDDSTQVVIEQHTASVSAFLTGVVMGAVLGVLFAPGPGSDLRRRIREEILGLRDRVEGRVKDAGGQVAERVDELRGEVRDRVDSVRHQVDDRRSDLEQRVEESRSAIRAGFEAARGSHAQDAVESEEGSGSAPAQEPEPPASQA